MAPADDDRLAGLALEELDSTSPRARAAYAILIVSVFLAFRVAFLFIREPFFDDLFTIWIARQELPDLIAALRLDSGPPLYYVVMHFVSGLFPSGEPAVEVVRYARWFSLAMSLLALIIFLLWARRIGRHRYLAALLLALFPPLILYSTEARAYLLCGIFVGVTVVALHGWIRTGKMSALIIATLAASLASYSHYYGVVILPLPFVASLFGDRGLRLRGFIASTAAALLFLPGYYLSTVQPTEATRWMAAIDRNAVGVIFSAARQLGFGADYPAALLEPAPLALQILSVLVVFAATGAGLRRSRDVRFFAAMTLVPVFSLAVIAQVRDAVYFPVRFESVLSVPFALMLACSIAALSRRMRLATLTVIVALSISVTWMSLMAQLRAGPSPTRTVAAAARGSLGNDAVFIASGSAWLELVSQTDSTWAPQILSFPSEQSLHPGWRSIATKEELDAERSGRLASLPHDLIFVGESFSGEFRSLTEACASRPLYRSGPTVMVLLACEPPADQF